LHGVGGLAELQVDPQAGAATGIRIRRALDHEGGCCTPNVLARVSYARSRLMRSGGRLVFHW
jgi:hypothetical protein